MSTATQTHQIRWNGIIVPYVASWSSEQPARVLIDPHAGDNYAVFCGGRRGEGRPVFGKMDYARQRQCVDRKLCQVCREKMFRMFALQVIPSWLVEGAVKFPLLTEPCICAGCARYALEHCPGLKRDLSHKDFLSAEVFQYKLVAGLLTAMEQNDYPELDRVLREFGGPAVGYLKLKLTNYDRLTLDEFTERITHG